MNKNYVDSTFVNDTGAVPLICVNVHINEPHPEFVIKFLAPQQCGSNFTNVIFKFILRIDISNTSWRVKHHDYIRNQMQSAGHPVVFKLSNFSNLHFSKNDYLIRNYPKHFNQNRHTVHDNRMSI